MKTIILDTETNKLNGYPIEIAYVPITIENGSLYVFQNEVFNRYFSCPEPIDIEAMAIHNIIESDIEGQPSCESFKLPNDVEYIVGHNIDYDIRALSKSDPAIKVKTICTLALARHVWPDLPSHKLAVLYYFVMKNREDARRHLRHAHSAKADIYFTGIILTALIERLGIKDLISLFIMSEAVRLPKIMTWGKHKGTPLNELPSPYITWLLNLDDLDPYLRKALQNI